MAKRTPRLTAAQRRALFALPDRYQRAPDRPIAHVVDEARELVPVTRRVAAKLRARTTIDGAVVSSLARRVDALVAAEGAWRALAFGALPPKLAKKVPLAEKLRRDVVAALRFFLADDERAQRQVDGIEEASNLAGLVTDLAKAADLLDEHALGLHAADLPADAADVCRALAQELQPAALADAEDFPALEAMDLRNRAFWHLKEAIDAVRAAGRYAFRDDKKLRAFFRPAAPGPNADAKGVRRRAAPDDQRRVRSSQLIQRPSNAGFRFSRNALMPSR